MASSNPALYGAASSPTSATDRPDIDTGGVAHVAIGVTLLALLPATLIAIGMAGQLRLLYPALTAMFAFWLFVHRPEHYLAFTLWVFMLTPLIRRLVDAQLGYQSISPVMLAPYLAALPCALALPSYALRQDNRYFLPFVLVLVAIANGLLLAILYGRVVSGAFDALRWGMPPLVALYVLANADRFEAFARTVERTLIWAVPLLGLYGVLQFVDPAVWDRLWMRNVQMNSIGSPEPYRVRVFSTLNSPGSFAMYLMAGLLVLQTRRGSVTWIGSAVGLVALLLTLSRSCWAGWLIAVAWFLVTARPSQVARAMFASVVITLGALVLLQVPEIGRPIEERIQSFTSLAYDNSAEDRLQQYAKFALRADEFGLGDGLARSGYYRMKAGEGIGRVIDSGLLETFESLGLVFSPLYFLGLGLMLATALRGGSNRPTFAIVASAVALGGFAQLPLGSIHIGEQGVLIWTFLGLALSERLRAERAAADGSTA